MAMARIGGGIGHEVGHWGCQPRIPAMLGGDMAAIVWSQYLVLDAYFQLDPQKPDKNKTMEFAPHFAALRSSECYQTTPPRQGFRPSTIAMGSLDSFTMLISLSFHLFLSRFGFFDGLLLPLLLFIMFAYFSVTMGYPDTIAVFFYGLYSVYKIYLRLIPHVSI